MNHTTYQRVYLGTCRIYRVSEYCTLKLAKKEKEKNFFYLPIIPVLNIAIMFLTIVVFKSIHFLINSSINGHCAAMIFSFAVLISNHSALSISGNDLFFPDLGGHSISNSLLFI